MSIDGDRSPKRQRRSFSPASPALLETKESEFVQHPQTPPPSVHMSPSWQSQHSQDPNAAVSNSNGGSISSASGGVTFPTPPSTASFQGPKADNMADKMDHSGPGTPEREAENERKRKRFEGHDEGATPAKRHEGESDVARARAETADAEHRRTDHERQGQSQGSLIPESAPVAPAPKLYKLRTQPVTSTRLHASQDVMSLYDLKDIQQSVARKDAQGNKINKLRKSYENKVKALGLEGRSKALVGNAALQGLVDPGWDMEVGPGGQTMWDQQRVAEYPPLGPNAADDLLGRLGSALSLAPGHLPKQEHEQWKAVLGLDDSKPMVAASVSRPGLSTAVTGNPALARTAPAQAARASAPASPNAMSSSALRPERTNKRRRYDESSYEGYDDDGYSTGGGDETGSGRRGSIGKRQKRKEFPPSASPPFTGNNNGMVGVRSS